MGTGRIGAALALALLAGAAEAEETRIAITLTIEPSALQRLIDMGEWVTVSAYYFGNAASDAAPVEEDGSVYLGGETYYVYPAASQMIVLGGSIAAMPAGWVEQPEINVNVFTARYAAEDNLLDCDLVEGPVSVIAATPNVIACRWLGE